jgi:hypothetical protein
VVHHHHHHHHHHHKSPLPSPSSSPSASGPSDGVTTGDLFGGSNVQATSEHAGEEDSGGEEGGKEYSAGAPLTEAMPSDRHSFAEPPPVGVEAAASLNIPPPPPRAVPHSSLPPSPIHTNLEQGLEQGLEQVQSSLLSASIHTSTNAPPPPSMSVVLFCVLKRQHARTSNGPPVGRCHYQIGCC